VEGVDPDEAGGAIALHFGRSVQLEDDATGSPLIRAWLPQYPEGPSQAQGLAAELGQIFPEVTITLLYVEEVPDEDWMAQWRKTVKPITMGKRILVIPTFDRPASGHGRIEVVLDPGMAFGSGHHPSTELCGMALEGHIGERVLDIGCGSGILSIIAALLGAKRVLAVDTDPEAVQVARTNVELNNVTAQIDLLTCRPEEVIGEFDVITANLFLDAHLALAGEYWRLTGPGGIVILSGLRNDQAQTVANRMTEEGFLLQKRMEKDGWTALLFSGLRVDAQ